MGNFFSSKPHFNISCRKVTHFYSFPPNFSFTFSCHSFTSTCSEQIKVST